MNTSFSRRHFLRQTAVAGMGTALAVRAFNLGAAEPASDRLRVGVMGLGRGYDHVQALLKIPNVELAYLCDVDENRLARGVKAATEAGRNSPQAVKDVRRILDDRAVDALFIAAPNFWHAPATILACAAGKHVYVEKPGSHNPWEGELMVAAARRHRRLVQMGNQRRSWPGVIEAMAKLRVGVIGRVVCARCYYSGDRPSIGRGRVVPVPAYLDYHLWQGPVPERPYVDNLVHYNWHWRWHWGGGELANNGIHAIDLARWGLGVEAPNRVTCNGGRYHFDDDQETPDTAGAIFDYGQCAIFFDYSSCHPRKSEPLPLVVFYGSEGSLIQEGGGYRVLDLQGKETHKATGPGGEKIHIENFTEAIRSGQKLNSEIEVGQGSTLLCHLGNMAYRTGGSLRFEPGSRKILDNAKAKKLWKRDYRSGWEPKV